MNKVNRIHLNKIKVNVLSNEKYVTVIPFIPQRMINERIRDIEAEGAIVLTNVLFFLSFLFVLISYVFFFVLIFLFVNTKYFYLVYRH